MGSEQNYGQTQSFLQETYKIALEAQEARALLEVATGKRYYENMLIESIEVETDQHRENILELRLRLREIIFTYTHVVAIAPGTLMLQPQKTAPVLQIGAAQTTNGQNFNSDALSPRLQEILKPSTRSALRVQGNI